MPVVLIGLVVYLVARPGSSDQPVLAGSAAATSPPATPAEIAFLGQVRTADPCGLVEILQLVVTGPRPAQERCRLARELAEPAAARLPS